MFLVAERKVEHQDLGIPDAEMVAAVAAEGTRGVGAEQERTTAFNLETPSGGQSIAKGGLVAFYAAQTIETTPEMPLPKGAEDAVKYGLFTYTIFSKLAENPNITYRQLGLWLHFDKKEQLRSITVYLQPDSGRGKVYAGKVCGQISGKTTVAAARELFGLPSEAYKARGDFTAQWNGYELELDHAGGVITQVEVRAGKSGAKPAQGRASRGGSAEPPRVQCSRRGWRHPTASRPASGIAGRLTGRRGSPS